MTKPTIDHKIKQLSLSQYEEQKTKKGKNKKLFDFPKPVAVIISGPLVFMLILFLGYIFYIRRLAAH